MPRPWYLLAFLAFARVGASCASDDTRAAITRPTIWVEPSPTLDPTALPLGDQRYVSDQPRHGYIYACDPLMFQMMDGPGASRTGDWIDQTAHTFDVTRKPFVSGNVYFDDARFSIGVTGDLRMVTSNGLPVNVPTGVFPVQPSEPAYQYDPNPNMVTPQSIAFAIPRQPVTRETASCVYKEVGITLDGVPLHNPLDSKGREELAYEIQDVCSGGPQPGGGYHRHVLSECTPQIHDRVALIGYALDGFGIFSPYDVQGRELTSSDLDECHGITSEIPWQGQRLAMYHYVMTRDYPYTVACFRGTPTRNAFPPLPGAPPQR